MKKFLILFLICFAQNTFSQEIVETDAPAKIITEENKVYNTSALDNKPEFQGGNEALNAFIQQNYKNPKDKTLKGNVYATFIIEKDGSVSNIKILRDIGSGTGDETIRILKKSPKWIPGKQNNNVVRSLYSLVIPINNFLK